MVMPGVHHDCLPNIQPVNFGIEQLLVVGCLGSMVQCWLQLVNDTILESIACWHAPNASATRVLPFEELLNFDFVPSAKDIVLWTEWPSPKTQASSKVRPSWRPIEGSMRGRLLPELYGNSRVEPSVKLS